MVAKNKNPCVPCVAIANLAIYQIISRDNWLFTVLQMPKGFSFFNSSGNNSLDQF